MDYEKLMGQHPTSYGTIVNTLGQTIEFYESPSLGDLSAVICVCHELRLAEKSTFFETVDIEQENSDYMPHFLYGGLILKYEMDHLEKIKNAQP